MGGASHEMATPMDTPGGDDEFETASQRMDARTPGEDEDGEGGHGDDDDEDVSTDDTDALERTLEAQMKAAAEEADDDEDDDDDDDDSDELEKDLFGGDGDDDDEDGGSEDEDDERIEDLKRKIRLARDKIRQTEPIVEAKKRDIERAHNRIVMVGNF